MTQTAPSPLPDVRDDPAIVAALDAQRRYEDRLAAIHADPGDELSRAEAVAEAYSELVEALTAHAEDLRTRRTARLEYLRSQIPTGPLPMPEDASPADKAVLAAEFRAALDRARAADSEQRRTMLDDAIRFDDVVTTRALLTVALERGEPQLLDQWAKAAGSEGLLTELRELESALNGAYPGAPWEGRAFRAPRRPREIGNLPLLRKQAEQRAREAERAARYSVPVYRRY